MSLPGWIICCGALAVSSSARPFMVFSSVPPLLCAFGSCTLNRTSWTTWDHLQETRQFAVGCPSPRFTPYFVELACDTEGWAVYFIAQRGDVRFCVIGFVFFFFSPIGSRETHLLLRRCRDLGLLVCVLNGRSVKMGEVSRKKTAEESRRFGNARCAIARAQAKQTGENSIRSWCMWFINQKYCSIIRCREELLYY